MSDLQEQIGVLERCEILVNSVNGNCEGMSLGVAYRLGSSWWALSRDSSSTIFKAQFDVNDKFVVRLEFDASNDV